MLLIECPWCGERDETEFVYGGEPRSRPPDPDALTDEQWGEYVFFRKNPRGLHREMWNHANGCRRWFLGERDTVTYRFARTYPISGTGGGNDAG